MSGYLQSLVQLLYPKQCLLCFDSLNNNAQSLCNNCLLDLPRTNFHRIPDNNLEKSLWGRIHFVNACAFLQYRKGNITQKAIHAVKYRGRKELGKQLGKLFVQEVLKEITLDIDYVVPVPLHRDKLKKRGFNQAEIIAEALADGLDIPLSTDFLYRKINRKSQTRRHRFERWLNMADIFEVKNSESYRDKHILLVDDVITTGATLEASAKAMEPVIGKLSIAALGFTYS